MSWIRSFFQCNKSRLMLIQSYVKFNVSKNIHRDGKTNPVCEDDFKKLEKKNMPTPDKRKEVLNILKKMDNAQKTVKTKGNSTKKEKKEKKKTFRKDNVKKMEKKSENTKETRRNKDGQKLITLDNMNQNIREMEYAVRGALVVRASEIEEELKKGKKYPFKEVVKGNIGDCHAMGQKPITFFRQVLTMVLLPRLLDDPSFPDDAKERACAVLNNCRGGSIGSYTESPGIEMIRKQVAEYIENRDRIPADWRNIILTAGASEGIKNIFRLLNQPVDGKKPGIMAPIPQYPLYSATITEFNMHLIGYYLDEDNNWGLNIQELKRAVDEGRQVSAPKAIVVINPGNPTGQVLTRTNIEEVIRFAHAEGLVIFADEVYQDNIYAENSEFHSFKKVLTEMGPPYNKLELASFMSCSKGYMGECGLRGGYTEILNVDPHVMPMLMKQISAMLCPNTIGQACIYCTVYPPESGEPSYEQFMKEKSHVLSELKKRAKMAEDTFNSIPGYCCNSVMGSMYAFPKFEIPEKAVTAARDAKMEPDVFYAFRLLEKTGICVIPGSGFKQKPNTWHFRTTILPQTNKLKKMLDTIRTYHELFVKEYS